MDVQIKDEYITLQQLLKKVGLLATGGEIKAFLSENIIYVNGEAEMRRGRKLVHGDVLVVEEQTFVVKGNNQE